jgi:hypothetical protein
MISKAKHILKNIIIGAMIAVSVSSAVYTSIPTAKAAGSSSILGTNAALGSPILNSTATTDNWNKWEMICWGVFLSNWCQPLIDTYETAYSTSTSVGSQGAGYQALCFGSGSDSSNNETIQDFCTYAIQVQQQSTVNNVWVAYTPVENGVLGEKPDPNTDNTVLRQATFNDFFFTSKNDGEADETYVNLINVSIANYGDDTATIYNGNIPTFYVQSASDKTKYTVILDYTDSWDIQAFAAMITAIRTSTSSSIDYGKLFKSAYESYAAANPAIGMDVFGNLVIGTDNVMLFPAANNQNITTTKSINILNSWIANNYISTYSSSNLINNLHQTDKGDSLGTKLLAWMAGSFNTDYNMYGLPAFGSDTVKNVGLLYYDTDLIASYYTGDIIENSVNTFAGGTYWGATNTGTYTYNSSLSISYIDMIEELFDCDITNSNTKYPIEFEVSAAGYGVYSAYSSDNIETTTFVGSLLPNTLAKSGTLSTTTSSEILHSIINTDGEEISLFSDNAIVIPVSAVAASEDSGAKKKGEAYRQYFNWLYKVYSGDNTSGLYSSSLKEKLNGTENGSISELSSLTKSTLWSYFTSSNSTYKNIDITGSTFWDAGNNEVINTEVARLVKAYPASNIMSAVSSALALKEGTEFNTYCTMIYMTYLDWYEVFNTTSLNYGTESTSRFNTEIYDESSDILKVDPSDITLLMSEDDMESEVLQMSYLMLSPEDGRSYRKQLIYNGIADFLYEQYNRLVYGGSSSVYTGSSTKSNTGFLAVPTFTENFLTSWFIDKYTSIAVIAIVVCMVLMIIFGLLKGRKISWYVLTTFTIVNVILLVPASGDITPAVTTNFTQKIFSSKMTFWALSEGVSNASIESDAYTSSGTMSGLTSEEATTVIKLINNLSVVYTDRSLMLKQDVSQKLTQQLGGIYTSIQSIQSARWILPMVMQQFSASDEQDMENYVYVKLANVWDDGSNLYWYYYPSDAINVTKSTTTSQQFVRGDAIIARKSDLDVTVTNDDGTTSSCVQEAETNNNGNKYDSIQSYYVDYVEPTWADDTSYVKADGEKRTNYACYSYTLSEDNNDIVHLYSYILHDSNLGMDNANLSRENVFGGSLVNYKDADSWQSWIDKAKEVLTSNNWSTDTESNSSYYAYEGIAESYDRTDTSTLSDGYSFYKTTESTYYYFFNVVKDSFPHTSSVGSVIGRLQGEIETAEGGSEVRSNFMYATKTTDKETDNGTRVGNGDTEYTGYVRDVLDLQEFFTNVLPYMYEMTLAAGGFDGESGILGNSTISDASSYYEGNMQSWAYRCNWAVKIMENSEYCKSTTIKDSAGNSYTITNPLLPEAYPNNRPMVFSEAQEKAYGLTDADLSIVELKCIAVNKAVAKDWTLLINYASTDGLTKEVLFRVMATDATEEFCQEFSTSGFLDTTYEIYPQSIDLRYLSFDAIMKMLMINVSKDTSYTYGDTMETLLEESDLFTAFLLLLCAAECVWIVPLAQQVLLALIFYLGFIAILKSLFSSVAYKGKVSAAQLVQNVTFMVFTLLYYLLISSLMMLSSSDEVLSVKSVSVTPGNPVWMLLAVILLSAVYILLMIRQIRFCCAHYRDMGLEVQQFMLNEVVARAQNAVGNIKSSIADLARDPDEHSNNTSNTASVKGTGASEEKTQNVNVKQTNESNITVNSKNDDAAKALADESAAASYNTGEEIKQDDTTTAADIDAEIKTGEKLESNS